MRRKHEELSPGGVGATGDECRRPGHPCDVARDLDSKAIPSSTRMREGYFDSSYGFSLAKIELQPLTVATCRPTGRQVTVGRALRVVAAEAATGVD